MAEGDVTTTELLYAFIGTSEATNARNRISTTLYLPPNLANLDQYAFDSSNLSEQDVNMTNFKIKVSSH